MEKWDDLCRSPYFSLDSCEQYEDRAKSSVTNRLPLFYFRYILKCFTATEWCVE